MRTTADYKREIINMSDELSADILKEIVDYAHFLKARNEGFTYSKVGDSAAYIRDFRLKEGKRVQSGKKFIKELIEWQKSNF